jgi:predicted nucleic acid-binding protein
VATEYILDASVALAWYLPEVFADEALEWLSKLNAGRITLHVPALHYLEVANGLRSQVRRGKLSEALAGNIWRNHLNAVLVTTDPSRDDVFSTALAYDASAYDAVYIALALELDAPLLTAERSTTPWVKKLGARAISIAALPS